MNKRNNTSIFLGLSCALSMFLTSLNQAQAQSVGFTTEDVKFISEGVNLAGTICTPQHAEAAVVIVHGSDQVPRMKEFAEILAKQNISVFTYDKRGVGESGGVYAGPEVGTNNISSENLNLLAKDASAAISILHQHNRNIPIGLL